MKVVCCKKCGAKYQLEDDDDINSFECTSCTGDLELCDGSTQKENLHGGNSHIVYCVECGLKYSLGPSDNILDYECEGCGGTLRYVDEYLNEDIDKIVEDREKQRIIQSIQGKKEENTAADKPNSIKSISDKFENFFSEKGLENRAGEIKEERIKGTVEKLKKTAKTKIPTATRRKFEKEFLVPKTNDYDVLKEFLKNEFYKGIIRYYGVEEPEEIPNGMYREFEDKNSYNNRKETIEVDFKNSVKVETDKLKNSKNIALVIGVIIVIMSAIELTIISSGIGFATLIVGIILIIYGAYRKKDAVEVKKRSKIIREHLLSLPEDYYVFYDVRVPDSNKGINHLVIGPSGIYEIISQKYNSKSAGKTIESTPLPEYPKEERIEEIINPNNRKSFKYTRKQTKFPKDDKIKQECLRLGENLINFLNENDIRNCFVEPLVGFVNDDVVVINMPLTDEDLFMNELLHRIEYGPIKLDSETIDKCAVLLSKFAADCSNYES